MKIPIRRAVAVAALCLAALTMGGCDFGDSTPARTAPCASEKATAEAQIKASEVQLEAQKRITTIQLDVAKRCADRGWIPVYINQNVGCNAPK